MSPRKSRYKPDYHKRRKFDLDALRTFLRLSDDEMRQIAEVFAEKLAQAKAKTVFVFPGKGWSAVDPSSGEMYDKEQDLILLNMVKEKAGPNLDIREVDANLEEEEFAEAITEACLAIFPRPQ